MRKKSTLYLLFNHKLTQEQEKNAYETLSIEKVIYFPEELLNIWRNISPEVESLSELLEPIIVFMDREFSHGDYLLVQGDLGATYLIAERAKQLNITPLYATTKRVATENIVDGKPIKTSIFSHVRFRAYGV
ncbi:MAG TPA: hypothetical protein EYH01_02265 [Campylobacterales bacterium]|nr:hypothetical protein [Campylobacterales bacterium]